MTKTTSDVLEDLRSFRSRLFEIDIDDDDISKAKLERILDEYQNATKYTENQFDAFAEEYLITRFGLEHVWKIQKFINLMLKQNFIFVIDWVNLKNEMKWKKRSFKSVDILIDRIIILLF